MTPEPVVVRTALSADGPLLTAIDDATWSPTVTPTPRRSGPRSFFGARVAPGDVLVAERRRDIAGYVALGCTPLASSAHVIKVHGLAVAPAHQRHGVARTLVLAAAREAHRRGARRLTLRVLGHNGAAQALYSSSGFVLEGVLREEFWLDGHWVDDHLMALDLTAPAAP